jgi:phage baseplate assembly protein gpV
MLYTGELVAPSDDPNLDVIEFEDGTVVRYDSGASKLQIEAVGDINVTCINATLDCESATVNAETVDVTAQAITVDADTIDVTAQSATVAADSVEITASTTHTGDITVNGSITVSGGDVVADGKSLKTHIHGGVTAGGATTTAPV